MRGHVVLQYSRPPPSLSPHLPFVRYRNTPEISVQSLPAPSSGRHAEPRFRKSKGWLGSMYFFSDWRVLGILGSGDQLLKMSRTLWTEKIGWVLCPLGMLFSSLEPPALSLWGRWRVEMELPVGQRPCRDWAQWSGLGLLDNHAAPASHPHLVFSGTGNSGQEGKIALCGLAEWEASPQQAMSQVLFRTKALHRVHSSKLYTFLW